MSDETVPNQNEQEKKALLIEVLDRGLLGLREAERLGGLLAAQASKIRCECRGVCAGCKLKCASGCLEA